MSTKKIILSIKDLKELRHYCNLIIPSLKGNIKIEWENIHSSISNIIGDCNLDSIEVNSFDKIYLHWSSMKWTKAQNIN